MWRPMIPALLLACGLAGCVSESSSPDNGSNPATQAAPPELTAERARSALIELIRSPDPGQLKDFPLERFAADGAESWADGSASWGPFALHLRAREYSYSRAFGAPPRVCRWHFRGGFEFKQGRWVAMPPRVESQALGPE